ncbi:MAG: DUF1456 family protein [Thalassotalea sp.]|nr:DUF1456 family protein [Thalassotalea sp.]MDG2393253.1 DUF1456 family protein [Thalassotalea sp.]
MINNDIIRRVSTIFNFDDAHIIKVFALGQCEISPEQLENFAKEKNDAQYVEVEDVELAAFLNGLIIEKRGKKDGAQQPNEVELNNNQIFNKLKIAQSLKAEEVISILELGQLSLTKYELSALFRNPNNKHFRQCGDDVLNAFIKGLLAQK